jgi:hypothetical protein
MAHKKEVMSEFCSALEKDYLWANQKALAKAKCLELGWEC